MKYISECDVIIYDLHSGNPRDLELAFGAFDKYKMDEEADPKILILISSVAVWKNTEPKLVEVSNSPKVPEGEGDANEGEGKQAKDGEGEGDEGRKDQADNQSDDPNPQAEHEGEEGEGEMHEQPQEVVDEAPPPEYMNIPYTEAEY